jgi:very-short-patch-repair endonuclease
MTKAPVYRSKFEKKVAQELGAKYTYETLTLQYQVWHNYIADFIDHERKIIISVKGRFRTTEERTKYLLLRDQNPDWTIIFYFQNPYLTISKKSSTTYKAWAEKNGFGLYQPK